MGLRLFRTLELFIANYKNILFVKAEKSKDEISRFILLIYLFYLLIFYIFQLSQMKFLKSAKTEIQICKEHYKWFECPLFSSHSGFTRTNWRLLIFLMMNFNILSNLEKLKEIHRVRSLFRFYFFRSDNYIDYILIWHIYWR